MRIFASALILTLMAGASASAQSVSPMKKDVSSFAERFMFQVKIRNTYEAGQVSHIAVYDLDWTPVEDAVLSHKSAFLGGGQKLVVTALVPFDEKNARQVYLCHTIAPRIKGVPSAYKGEVCGKYTAKRLS